MSMIKGTVWLRPEEDALRERIQKLYAERHRANGLHWDPRTLRDMVLSEACTRGLEQMAAEKLPPPKPGGVDNIAKALQALFNGQADRQETAA